MAGRLPPYRTLCELTDIDLAQSLREAIKTHPEDIITSYLIEAVECDGIPSSVLRIWLSVSHSPRTLVVAIRAGSQSVRKRVILLIGKLLKRKEWRAIWEAFGGIQGIIELFEASSVQEVGYLVAAFRKSAKSAQRDSSKQEEFVALFKALLPQWYPKSSYKTQDHRQLSGVYSSLLPLCPSPFILDFLTRATLFVGRKPLCMDNLLVSVCLEDFWKLAIDRVKSKDKTPSWVEGCWSALLERIVLYTQHFSLSASIEFLLDVLQALRASNGETVSDYASLNYVILPLLRQMEKRELGWDTIRVALDKALEYVEKSNINPSALLDCVVRCWSKSSDSFSHPLTMLLKLIGMRDPTDLRRCHASLQKAPVSRRFELLRLLGLYACRNKVDVEDPSSLARLDSRIQWAHQVFQELSQEDALQLLDTLRDSFGHDPQISLSRYGVMARRERPTDQSLDVQFFRLSLTSGVSDSIGKAVTLVQEKQRLASRSREQSERCWYAEAAYRYSIVSGDLRLYGQTIEWSRRFLRDPLTIATLFGRDIVANGEAISLLSGLRRRYNGLSRADIGAEIREANQVLLKLLGFACSALREPSFQKRNWDSVLSLFGSVVRDRAQRSSSLQEYFDLSNDELYDLVWENTLSMLVSAEKTGLSQDYSGLGFNTVIGPLQGISFAIWYLNPALSRFFDRLAEARNSLWLEKRALDDPATTVLPAPWPQGLPIQWLIPFPTGSSPKSTLSLPYLMERARSIVLMPRSIARSEIPDEELQKTIKGYVNSFSSALACYVNFAPSKEEKEKRISGAWLHALSSFSSYQMSQAQTTQIWWPVFAMALGKSFENNYLRPLDGVENLDEWHAIERRYDWQVTIPDETVIEAVGNTEWNPSEAEPAAIPEPTIPERTVDAAAIDCCQRAPGHSLHGEMPFVTPKIYIPGFDPHTLESRLRRFREGAAETIWSLGRFSKESLRSGRNLEGLLASSLLYVDISKKGSSRILSTRFPVSTPSPRWPALFLDDDFLSKDHDFTSALYLLERLLPRVPPSMLLTISQGAFDSLASIPEDAPEAGTVEHILYKTLILLSRCDRPTIASNLICAAIVDRSDSSSWYRHFLNRSFLKRLSPNEARKFVEDFADRVIRPNTKPAITPPEVPVSVSGKASETPAKPYVKVTTVKMLAQLLVNGDIFSVPTAITILKQILVAKSHIDVRVAAVDAAVELISTTPKNELSHAVLQQMESFLQALTPLIGSMSERDGSSDEMWKASYADKDLPDVEQGQPLYYTLVRARDNKNLPKSIRKTIAHRILLPALDESIKNNRRWLGCFVEKHGLDINITSYAIPPKNLPMLVDLLTSSIEWLPKHYLELYHNYTMLMLNQPPGLIRSIEIITKHPGSIRACNGAEHWLNTFQKTRVTDNLRISWFAFTLYKDWTWEHARSLIRLDDVLECILQQAQNLLENQGTDLSTWDKFLIPYSAPLRNQPETHPLFKTRIRPLIAKFIAMIESYRADEAWQRDPSRSPPRLPSVFGLRLRLLSYPYLGNEDSHTCEEFANELCSMIDELVQRVEPYYHDFNEMKSAVAYQCSSETKANVGLVIGKSCAEEASRREVATRTLLRIELASSLLRTEGGVDSVMKECRSLLSSWLESECEPVRERAWALSPMFEKSTSGSPMSDVRYCSSQDSEDHYFTESILETI